MFICFDLDHTLLSNNINNKLTEYTLKVLNKAKEEGHVLVVNTARNLKNAMKYLEIIKPDYSILNAGSLIVDSQFNILYEKKMSNEITTNIINDLNSSNHLFLVDCKEGLFSNILDDKNIKYDFSTGFDYEAYKIVPKDVKLEDANMIKERYDVAFTLYLNGVWSRFNHKDANKLSGLEYVVLTLERGNMKDTISFGDDYSDLPMLLGSGIGVCVENSVDEVKKKAKFHTKSCDEDGVARFLVDYFKFKI